MSSGTAALEIILRCLDVPAARSSSHEHVRRHRLRGSGAAESRCSPTWSDTFAVNAATVAPCSGPDQGRRAGPHRRGVPADVGELRALCDEAGIPLVEDAAHAHGSALDGRHAGTFGIAGAFSFYPTKIITSGEGGMILTADARLRDEARIYRDQGKAAFGNNVHVWAGYAWRMSELHAAIGLVTFAGSGVPGVRRRVAAHYDAALDDLDGVDRVPVPPTATGTTTSTWHCPVAAWTGRSSRNSCNSTTSR